MSSAIFNASKSTVPSPMSGTGAGNSEDCREMAGRRVEDRFRKKERARSLRAGERFRGNLERWITPPVERAGNGFGPRLFALGESLSDGRYPTAKRRNP